jgi:two-component system LytT family response regulator
MINAIIIDDEEISLKSLCEKINTHCPEIKVLKLFTKPEQALKEMDQLNPQVVFLDIEMPRMNGFTFLKHCSQTDFQVIFTTAYSEYAINALRISALDFLLKPIDTKELIAAETRLVDKIKSSQTQKGILQQQLQLFLDHRQHPASPGKIAIPVLNGLEFIDTTDIIKIQGENVYSVFYLSNGKKMVASLTLKETETMLGMSGFFRVHKSYIINLKYMARYIKGEGGVVVLTDGSEVEVSRRNKAAFLKLISTK